MPHVFFYFYRINFTTNRSGIQSAAVSFLGLCPATAADRDAKCKQQQRTGEENLSHRIGFTHLPLVLLLVLLTESELEERLREPDLLWERGGRVA